MPNGGTYRVEPVMTLAFGGISGTYADVGNPTTKAASQVILQNLTDATIMFSFDAPTDHIPLPPMTAFIDDICANKDLNTGLFASIGTQFSVRSVGSNPTVGAVYITITYSK